MKVLHLEVRYPIAAHAKNHISLEKSKAKDAKHPNHIQWPAGAAGEGGCGCRATTPLSFQGGRRHRGRQEVATWKTHTPGPPPARFL